MRKCVFAEHTGDTGGGVLENGGAVIVYITAAI